jgi:hypothetical protein
MAGMWACNDGEVVGDEGMLGRALDDVLEWAATMEEDFGRDDDASDEGALTNLDVLMTIPNDSLLGVGWGRACRGILWPGIRALGDRDRITLGLAFLGGGIRGGVAFEPATLG